MYRFSRAIYRELASDIIEDAARSVSSCEPRARPTRLRGRRSSGWRPTATTSRVLRGRLFTDIRALLPDDRAGCEYCG